MASSKVMLTSSSSTTTSTSTISDLNHHHHLNHNYTPNHLLNRTNHFLNHSQMIPDLRNSDLVPRHDIQNIAPMTVDGFFCDEDDGNEDNNNGCNLMDDEIGLIDAAGAISAVDCGGDGSGIRRKTVEDVWRDIVDGGSITERKECKVEDEMMTLEDFLAKATAEEDDDVEDEDVKVEASVAGGMGLGMGMQGFDNQGIMQGVYPMMAVQQVGIGGIGAGHGAVTVAGGGRRGKRSRGNGGGGVMVMEPLMDKASQQRQRRMIKNRESAARSRERKQAYQVELESLAAKLEEENEQLLKEKADRAKQRYTQLMEKVVPVAEKRRPPRTLRRVRSMQW